MQKLCEILREQQSAVDTSNTGTGKTFVAAAVAATLKLATLVVAPKISESSWRNAAAHFSDSISFIGYEALRTGRSPFGHWDNTPPAGFRSELFLKCEYCQLIVDENTPPCYCNPQGIHCVDTKKKPWRYGRFNFHPAIQFLIFDEIHRCSGIDSLNADMLIAAKRQGIKILGLSATLASSPTELRAIGYALDLHKLTDFYSWAGRLGVRRIPGAGLKWAVSKDTQRSVMAGINSQLIPARGVHVSVAEIPGFPTCDISAELYDLDNSGRIDSLYAEMAESLAALRDHSANDKCSEHPLTKMLRAHQQIELLKVPLAVELTNDYLAKGFSVALFVNFSETIAQLSQRLKTNCIIDGKTTGPARDNNISQYQTNRSRKIIVNNKAGGICVSLQDLDGEHPRVGLVFPCFSARDMIQIFGRLPREGGKSHCHYRVMLAAGTVEVKMHRAVNAKRLNIAALNDEDLSCS